jgi:hypothetical protein
MTNLLRAFSDQRAFGKHFAGPSWNAWRAFLAALDGGPLSALGQLATYTACTGRTAPPAAPFREAALICGRRAGKSRVLAALAVSYATMKDWRQYLAPGYPSGGCRGE